MHDSYLILNTGGGNLLDSSIISDDEEIDVKLTILDEFYSKIEKLDLSKLMPRGMKMMFCLEQEK